MTQPLHLKAYAKVNLGLDVLRRREDGYHEVRMIMQTVKLFDYITLQKNTCGQIRLSSNLPYLPLNEKNLVYRAIDTIRTAYNISDGVDAAIEKHIPVAAGMAGGSTDAAAALVGMNQLFSLGITQDELIKHGLTLGADIPFCIMRGTALSEGIGEILTPLPSIPPCWFLIVKPSFSMSTKFVYEHLHLDEQTAHPDIDGMIQAISHGDLTGITDRMGNVLEQVTEKHYPAIVQIKKDMRRLGAVNALMSGSGSTVFGIFTSREAAGKAAEFFHNDPGIRQTAVVRPFSKNLPRSKSQKNHNHFSKKNSSLTQGDKYVLAGRLAGGGCGHRAGSLSCLAGAGHRYAGGAAAAGRVLAAHRFQRRAHPVGLRAGRSVQRGAGGSRRKVGVGGRPSRPRDAAGQGYSGGELHHSGAGVGQRLVAVRPYQLFDGAARPLQRSAHRHREC